jgi:glutathione S-transferase
LRESAGAARRFKTLSVAADIDACQTNAHALLRHLDRHLWFEEDERAGWLCPAPHPTIADIACFPHVMLAPEGGISFLEYPAVRRWTHRVKKIPGFIPMPGIFPA